MKSTNTSYFINSLIIYRVVQYQNAIQGLIGEVEQLYRRINEVQSLLDLYGIDLGILPSLTLPTLVLPSISLDWELPGSFILKIIH